MDINISKSSKYLNKELQIITDNLQTTSSISDHVNVWSDYLDSKAPLFTESDWYFHFKIFGLTLHEYTIQNFRDDMNQKNYKANPFAIAFLSKYIVSEVISDFDLYYHYHFYLNAINECFVFGKIKKENIDFFAENMNWDRSAEVFAETDKYFVNQSTFIKLYTEMQEKFFIDEKQPLYNKIKLDNFWKLVNFGLKLSNSFFTKMIENQNALFKSEEFKRQVRVYLEDDLIDESISKHITDEGKMNVIDFLETIKNNKALNVLIKLN